MEHSGVNIKTPWREEAADRVCQTLSSAYTSMYRHTILARTFSNSARHFLVAFLDSIVRADSYLYGPFQWSIGNYVKPVDRPRHVGHTPAPTPL